MVFAMLRCASIVFAEGVSLGKADDKTHPIFFCGKDWRDSMHNLRALRHDAKARALIALCLNVLFWDAVLGHLKCSLYSAEILAQNL